MSKKLTIYSLLALGLLLALGACNTGTNPDDFVVPPHRETVAKPEGAIRLMTYNVLRFVYDQNDPYNYSTIASMVKEKEVDAICLNELDKHTTRSRNDDQLQLFAQALGGWDYEFGSAMPYKGGDYGEGIATREPAVRQFSIPLPKGSGAEPRVLVVMELEDYVIATTHLDHVSSEAQLGQVEKITAEIAKLYKDSDKPVFLGGDLNATPDSKTIKLLEQSWRRLSSTQPTFPSRSPKSCIDYIFQYINGVECEVLHTEVIRFMSSGNPATASDHLPVIVDVKILGKH
ncbi:MAG: endonuclease/exonuclease/phosphatase family protein [Porphyromonas sp.]|nr:endonuclease/exonuclease/phosphatase family protein [Porphyromonas sp.]